MVHICPKCSYIRQPTDEAPEWQCPSCQVAYNKAGGSSADSVRLNRLAAADDSSSSGFGKWLLIVLALLAVVWFVKPGGHKAKAAMSAISENQPQPTAGAESGNVEPDSTQVNSAQAGNSQPKVILYGTEWCGYCAAARGFFAANGIQYTDVDVEKTTEGYKEHKRLGGNGVPLIVVGDQVFHGYSEDELRNALQPWMKS